MNMVRYFGFERMCAFAFAALLLSGCAGAQDNGDEPGPRAALSTGVIEGERQSDIHVFRAIPYAAPPVGASRWQPPQPVEVWDGIRMATAFGPACIQPPVPPSSLYFDPPEAMSEDCLTLNVWAPPDADHAPVIVWIHGGSLRIGSNAQALYDGSAFAQRGAIFVSINYRLGVLGWLAHPGLTAESPHGASGNYGLLDQIAALEWVRDNAAAFGGDPGNVTIMGESAGALSVTYLLASPLADGLFHRAIAQSPNIRAVPELTRAAHGLPSAESLGASLADALGAPGIDQLRAMDAAELTNAASQHGFPPQGTIDGWSLPVQVIEAFEQNRQAAVPLLAGFNSGELRSQRALLPALPDSAQAYEDAIRCGYGDLTDDFLALYPSSDIARSTLDTFRDAIYGWAVERMVHGQTARGVPAYLYIFDHCDAAARARDLCAFHASELPYVFGRIGDETAYSPNWPVPEGDEERALSNTMLDYWVSFAANGVPESAAGPDWPAYSGNEAYMHFSATARAARDPVAGMFEMHSEFIRRRREASQPWFLGVGVNAGRGCQR